MTNAIDARAAIAEWFETDFKDSAKATTKTSRLEDGRLSYSFSVVKQANGLPERRKTSNRAFQYLRV